MQAYAQKCSAFFETVRGGGLEVVGERHNVASVFVPRDGARPELHLGDAAGLEPSDDHDFVGLLKDILIKIGLPQVRMIIEDDDVAPEVSKEPETTTDLSEESIDTSETPIAETRKEKLERIKKEERQ